MAAERKDGPSTTVRAIRTGAPATLAIEPATLLAWLRHLAQRSGTPIRIETDQDGTTTVVIEHALEFVGLARKASETDALLPPDIAKPLATAAVTWQYFVDHFTNQLTLVISR